MNTPVLIKNVRVIDVFADVDAKADVLLKQGVIDVDPISVGPVQSIDGRGCILAPGFVDLHVHFREPGFTHKADIRTGILSALAGGVTTSMVMPNTEPIIATYKDVKYQHHRALSYDLMVAGSATKNGKKVCDIGELALAGAKAITDDGKPVLDPSFLLEIFRQCRRHNLLFMQHAEDLSQSMNASLNEGKLSRRFQISGQPKCAEFNLIDRDINLATQTGVKYHCLHISCKESLDLVQRAKRRRVQVSCEVAPHHLLLNEWDVRNLNTNRKMNPPLRLKSDVDALFLGLCDGSIDAVASDHAPHTIEEKRQSFEAAPFGVLGLQSTILALLTLVKTRGLPLKRAIEVMTTGPARLINEATTRGTMLGEQALKNAVLIDPNVPRIFSRRQLIGRAKNSPFIGMNLFGRVLATFQNGEMVYHDFP